jgi:uncharacterized protein
LAAVRSEGPVTAVELEQLIAHEAPRDRSEWGWNWSVVKRITELLFWAGEVTSCRRNLQFARLYDLPERTLPPAVWAAETPTPQQAHRELISLSARAFGVATAASLRDYFRLGSAEAKTAIASLVADGELQPVTVAGWRHPAFVHADAQCPPQVWARALISPFDSLVWDRARTAALFDFEYRIEIYVPAAKRIYGYYVLPFLLGDRLVARVDVKADRQAGVLRVQAAYGEPSAPAETAIELRAELELMASWLGLSGVEFTGRGDLNLEVGRKRSNSA